MDVAIDGHGASDLALFLHAPNGDRDVMDHAEAFAVVGMSMMKSATDIEGDTISQSTLCGQDGAARSQPKGRDQLLGIGQLQKRYLAGAKRSGKQLVNIILSVDQADVVIRGRL